MLIADTACVVLCSCRRVRLLGSDLPVKYILLAMRSKADRSRMRRTPSHTWVCAGWRAGDGVQQLRATTVVVAGTGKHRREQRMVLFPGEGARVGERGGYRAMPGGFSNGCLSTGMM